MDDQHMAKKQNSSIKIIRLLSRIAFILLLLYFFYLTFISFYESSLFSFLNDGGYLMQSLLFLVLELNISNRKKAFSILLIVYIFSLLGIQIYGLYAAGSSYAFINILRELLYFSHDAIFILILILFLRKNQSSVTRRAMAKPVFILFIVTLALIDFFYVYVYGTAAHNRFPSIVFMLFINTFIPILLASILYKGITNDVFYKNFIQSHPLAALKDRRGKD